MNAKTSKTRHSLSPANDLESSGSNTQPDNCGEDNFRVTRSKIKLNISHPESPTKRQRGASKSTEAYYPSFPSGTGREIPKKKQRGGNNNPDISEPTEDPVEGLMVNGTKRKASTERETPSKRQGGRNTNTNTGEPTEVPMEDVRETESKDEVSAEPSMRREIGCKVSPSSSNPSTSQQNNGSASRVNTHRAKFEAKYLLIVKLGEGGFGSVYAGKRKTDNLPVAIKYIPKVDVEMQKMVINGRTHEVPMEVLFMLRVAGGPKSLGKSAAVSLLDWYDLDQEVLLVMERPVPSVNLFQYLQFNGPLSEDQAKNILKQLVEATIKLHSLRVFHRDIKTENILVETGSKVPRVRIIDFGCSCFARKGPFHRFSGTSAYAPPEFYLNGTYKAGPTTVWQLGALLYELLDGYTHCTTSKVLCNKITFDSQLSQDCQDLLRMCLKVEPRQRATLEQMQQHPWFT